jgi:hypothetical protein
MLIPAPRTRWSMIAKVLAWWRPRMQANSERSGRETVSPGGGSREPDTSPLGVPAYDVSLLFRRLAVLQIDQDELASDDPLLFRELQGLCTLCGSKGRCVRDLAREGDGAGQQDWREYCPNATTLNALGAVQNCSWAARHLKTPHSTGYLASS